MSARCASATSRAEAVPSRRSAPSSVAVQAVRSTSALRAALQRLDRLGHEEALGGLGEGLLEAAGEPRVHLRGDLVAHAAGGVARVRERPAGPLQLPQPATEEPDPEARRWVRLEPREEVD